ncbi:hypothetical protein [Siminovitchia sp. 179-K 8D1 HS]|uniref:hypothetical protein n=1 Tax=Siminovitchia sp. 179-K 8D1 HS TaxID=3142385 RepID=UPI0039A206FF
MLNQSIGRNGGRGVSVKAKLRHKEPQKIINQSGGRKRYVGKNAQLVLNNMNQVITVFGSSRAKRKNQVFHVYGKGKNSLLGGVILARIKDISTEFELVPRKYEEKTEDPFIFSIFRITINNKPLINLYSPLLLKSEYDDIIYNLGLLLKNKTNNFILETVEQLFNLEIIREGNDIYRLIITSKQTELYDLEIRSTKNSLQQFYTELKRNLNNVQKSSYLP